VEVKNHSAGGWRGWFELPGKPDHRGETPWFRYQSSAGAKANLLKAKILHLIVYNHNSNNDAPVLVAARLLRSWVRIPPGAWMSVCYECCVLSSRGLCDELISRPEESYRLWPVFVCDLEKQTSWMRRPRPTKGLSRQEEKVIMMHCNDLSGKCRAKFGLKLSVPPTGVRIMEKPPYMRNEYFALHSYCFPNEHDRRVCFFQLPDEVSVKWTSSRSLQACTVNSPCDLLVARSDRLQVLNTLGYTD
jgi:hypothetical protein